MPSTPPSPADRGMVRVVLTKRERVRSMFADPACDYLRIMMFMGWHVSIQPIDEIR